MEKAPPDPYRFGEKRPPTELERLAAEGHRRHDALAHQQRDEATREYDRHLAVAIGGHFGTPFLRAARNLQYGAIAALAIVIALAATNNLDKEVASVVGGPLGLFAFLLLFVRVFWTPTATRARCDEEAAWVRSLPFELTGYFEALSRKPGYREHLGVRLDFGAGRVPESSLLLGIVLRLDPEAGLTHVDSATALRWMSGAISGATGIRINRQSIYRNHRLVKYVHELVDGALLPLHGDYQIVRVVVERR
jgi:hypothetical protein